jgi:hypothetical protein
MKIKKVVANNRKEAFEVHTRTREYLLPYAATQPSPGVADRVLEARVDEEMGNEGFVYTMASGEEGAVHIDHILEYNKDPTYLVDMVLYKLTVWAQEDVEKSDLSTRELIRRLGTSPAQFYRLLDLTNYRKSMRQLLVLLQILGCNVDVSRTDPIPVTDTP